MWVMFLLTHHNAVCVSDGEMDMTRQAKDGLGSLGMM